MDDMKVKLEIDLEGNLQTEARRNAQALGQFSQQGQRQVRELASSFAEAQKHFGEMTGHFAKAGGGLLIASRLTPAIKVSANLQEQIIGVKTELMGTVKSAAEMEKSLKQIGDTAFDIQAYTPFDQTQVVALEKALIKGGAQIGHVIGKTGATAAAAALAVQEEMAPEAAGNALIGIAGPFKIAADGYMALANSISAAGSASITGAADIAESSKYAAGPMAELGRSAEEMFAISAMMANRGVVGSSAGTGMANFFRKASEVKAFKDDKGNLKSTDEITRILQAKTEKMGSAQRIEFLTKVFGDEGSPVALALLADGGKGLQSTLEQMRNASSLQDKMNERMNGFNAQWEGLKGTLSSTFATLFDPALQPLTEIIKKTSEWVGQVGKLAGEHREVAVAVTAVATAVAAAGAAYGAVQIYKGGRSAIDMMKALRGGAAGTGKAGASGGMVGGLIGRGSAVPVYLVDGPMSTIPDRSTPGGAAGEAVKETTKRGGRLGQSVSNAGNVGKQFLKGGGALAVVGGAIDAGMVLASDARVDQKVEGVSGAVGGAAGAWAGAAAGAALGSFVPVVGTAIGALIGGALGYAGGEWLGEKGGQAINSALDLKVTVEGPPGTTANVSNMKATGTELNADVYNGTGMVMP